ncbi:hypothetical protein HYC85_008885 [Camellia sinensis]|uniref:Uncharacterized protein n=1 Tax=Camellia sinensis TaxID=4442 RepID=A0A7J7HTP5_CAMSI|nr:hypothetical protein HYC85_008885 [Camellia sinensis]
MLQGWAWAKTMVHVGYAKIASRARRPPTRAGTRSEIYGSRGLRELVYRSNGLHLVPALMAGGGPSSLTIVSWKTDADTPPAPTVMRCSGCTQEYNLHRPIILDKATDFFNKHGVSDFTFETCRLWGWRCRVKLAVQGSSTDPLIGLYQEGCNNVCSDLASGHRYETDPFFCPKYMMVRGPLRKGKQPKLDSSRFKQLMNCSWVWKSEGNMILIIESTP